MIRWLGTKLLEAFAAETMKTKPAHLLVALLAACSSADRGPPTPQAPPAQVRLVVGERVTPFDEVRVLSVDDANQRFHVYLALRGTSELGPEVPALVMGERRIPVTSHGRTGEVYELLFQVERADAVQLAAALATNLIERPPWTARLCATLEPIGELRAGAERLPLRFTLLNSGPVAVWFLDGGRQRNELGRDNRFEFEVTRDGAPLELRKLFDFGGIGVYRRLEPGQSHVLELDLAHWCRLERAGEYAIAGRYTADVMPAQYQPGEALPMGGYAHLNHEVAVPAQTTVTVR